MKQVSIVVTSAIDELELMKESRDFLMGKYGSGIKDINYHTNLKEQRY